MIGRTIDAPLSLVSLANALDGVVRGDITDISEFVAAAAGEEQVIVAADGPTWEMATLRERYGENPIRELAMRKIDIVERSCQTIYKCRWDELTITRAEFRPEDQGKR